MTELDAVSALLKEILPPGALITREDWVALNWYGDPPEPGDWTAEDELELPQELQRGDSDDRP